MPTVLIQLHCDHGGREQLPDLPTSSPWTPWKCNRGKEDQCTSMAAHKLMRESGHMQNPTEQQITVRAFHNTPADWKENKPTHCNRTDFSFTKN